MSSSLIGESPPIFWTGAEVVAHQLPEVGFLVESIVPKGGIVLLHGKYGSYKTPLSIHLAHSVATGQPFLGLEVTQTKVLYIEGDTPMLGIWPRLQQMNPNTTNLDFAFIYPGFNVVQPQLGEHNKMICSQLAQRHAEHRYGLVVVDSLRTSHSLPDKDSEVPTIVYGSFSRLFPGATVFIVHHDRKTKIPDGKGYHQPNPEVDNESFSGSQAWIDRATTSLKILKGYGGDKQWITLTQSKSQVGIEITPIQVRVVDGCQFSTANDLDFPQIEAYIQFAQGKDKNRTQFDKGLAEFHQVPLKYAAVKRAAYEAAVKKLF